MLDYRKDIDGLRAIAVLLVVLFHLFPWILPGGFVGVDVFFVISGFVITRTAILNGVENFSISAFYRRRVRRIFPSLIIVLVSCLVLGWIQLFGDEYADLGLQTVFAALFSSNFLFWSEAGYWDLAAQFKPLLHTWSLGVEEQFYLLWPVALYLAGRSKLSLFWTAVLVGGLSLAASLYFTKADQAVDFYWPITQFWELMVGCALAARAGNAEAIEPRFPLDILGAVLLAASALLLQPRLEGWPGGLAVIPVVGAALVIGGRRTKSWLHWALTRRPVAYVGKISFDLYLWHWVVLFFAGTAFLRLDPAWLGTIVVVVSFVLAVLTYEFVGKPARSAKRGGVVTVSAVACMSIVLAAAASVYWLDGIPSRAAEAFSLAAKQPKVGWSSDGSCRPLLDAAEIKNETCLTNSQTPQYLFVGDSHALVLYSPIVMGSVGLPAALVSGGTCPPFTNYSMTAGSELETDRNCDLIARQAVMLARRTPSIKTVVLSSMGPEYFSGFNFSGGRTNFVMRSKSGALVTDFAAAFVDGYSKTIGELLALGKRVVFYIDVPEIGFYPTDCIQRPIQFYRRGSCVLTREAVDDRQATYRQLIARIKQQEPGVKIVDPIDLFCDKEQCVWKRGNASFYFDTHHLTPAGGLVAIQPLLNEAD